MNEFCRSKCLVDESEVKGEWPDQFEKDYGDSDNFSTNLLFATANQTFMWMEYNSRRPQWVPLLRQEQDTKATLGSRSLK